MTSLPPSTLTRAIVITEITFNLAKRLRRPLLVKLSIDGTQSQSVLLKQGEEPTGKRLLQVPLNLLDGSILSVQVQEKHRVRSDQILAQLNLSLENIWPAHEPSVSNIHPNKYQVCLPDPKQQIWLHIAVVASSPQANSSDPCAASQTTKEVSEDLGKTKALEDATLRLQEFKSVLDNLGPARDPLDKVLKIAEVVAELHPIAKAVVKVISAVYTNFEAEGDHREEMLSLVKNMAQTLSSLPTVEKIAAFSKLKDTIKAFPELLDETVVFIQDWLDSRISNFFNASENRDRINKLKARYDTFKDEFDRGVAINSAIKIDNVEKLHDLQELEAGLGGIKEVNPRAHRCMEGTRMNILSDVESKIDDLESKNVVWISGAPGSGKSAVSLTIKSRLHDLGRLGTYFRFDRNEASVTTSRALWCRVSFDLAKRYPSVLTHNLSLLRENKVDFTSTADLFNCLVEEPLSQLTDDPPGHPIVIVIDALDECGGHEGRSSAERKALLQTLKRWSQLPKYLKLLVTSRDESDISRVLSSISVSIEIPSGNFLTHNPDDEASKHAANDIRKFLEGCFQDIREDFPLFAKSYPDWPGEDTIMGMVYRAAGNFMWATATAEFIGSGHPKSRLDSVMGQAPESMRSLYFLYSTILDTSFGKFAQNSSEAQVLRAVLGVIIFSRRSLHDVEYTKLPAAVPVDNAMVDLIRNGLSSVIDKGPTLRFIHKSFDDFLVSEECPPKYAINEDEAQHLLTKLCLTTMTTELCFNICSLETSCLKNADVPDIETKVSIGIPILLSYSCCYWADHLSRMSFNEQLKRAVKDMVFDKLLYWFEAMSLLKEITRVSYSLLSVLNWVKSASDEELNDFIRDAHRFIGAFSYPISQSAPHIYISALPFAPECSLVVRQFISRFPRILSISRGKPADWSPCVFTSEHHGGSVGSVAFSPDEKHFVSGSMSMCICDSETGLISGLLMGPRRHWVMSSFFDPGGQRVWARYGDGQVVGWDVETGDKHLGFQAGGEGDVIGCCCTNGGRNIVSVSKAGTVVLWNADTGERLHNVLKLPSRDVARVSFSQDGSYMAWAGTDDTTIRIWKLAEREEIHDSYSQPHAEPISTLSFSVDGHFAVSGSKGGTIVIQDARTGDILGRPLTTDKGEVDAVAYSHENNILVSASGNPGTVMVWNASTHEAVLGPLEGHTSIITAIALSRAGRRALTASWDQTVRMWDLVKKGVVPVTDAAEGTREVRDVAFSPCGKKLASLDRETIRVWDVSTGKSLLSFTTTGSYQKFTFSPDGSQIVAFKPQFIRAWSANTGEATLECNLGDGLISITHAAFRSTDQRLVTCFDGGDVRIWRIKDNSLIEDLPASRIQSENPDELVWITALSPDGSTLIVRDDSRNPRHYLWSTITRQPLPLTFIDDAYISTPVAAYSPSGMFFAAASEEGILRVWNMQTGQLVARPAMHNGPLAYLAFSPDDCHVAFSYSSYKNDTTAIWIWNAQTASLVSGPWKAHIDRVITLAFSPDGGKLVSAFKGGQFGIWNTADLLGHLRASAGCLEVREWMQDGWLTDTSGNLLFWVPTDHRSRLIWSENAATICSGGRLTWLNIKRLRYGKDWAGCFAGRTQIRTV